MNFFTAMFAIFVLFARVACNNTPRSAPIASTDVELVAYNVTINQAGMSPSSLSVVNGAMVSFHTTMNTELIGSTHFTKNLTANRTTTLRFAPPVAANITVTCKNCPPGRNTLVMHVTKGVAK